LLIKTLIFKKLHLLQNFGAFSLVQHSVLMQLLPMKTFLEVIYFYNIGLYCFVVDVQMIHLSLMMSERWDVWENLRLMWTSPIVWSNARSHSTYAANHLLSWLFDLSTPSDLSSISKTFSIKYSTRWKWKKCQ
jgi:hypothetical protein